MSERQVVWVVDMVGYDARGGFAEVYSSLDKAKAAAGFDDEAVKDEHGWWWRSENVRGSGSDTTVIWAQVLDDPEATVSEEKP